MWVHACRLKNYELTQKKRGRESQRSMTAKKKPNFEYIFPVIACVHRFTECICAQSCKNNEGDKPNEKCITKKKEVQTHLQTSSARHRHNGNKLIAFPFRMKLMQPKNNNFFFRVRRCHCHPQFHMCTAGASLIQTQIESYTWVCVSVWVSVD